MIFVEWYGNLCFLALLPTYILLYILAKGVARSERSYVIGLALLLWPLFFIACVLLYDLLGTLGARFAFDGELVAGVLPVVMAITMALRVKVNARWEAVARFVLGFVMVCLGFAAPAAFVFAYFASAYMPAGVDFNGGPMLMMAFAVGVPGIVIVSTQLRRSRKSI